jgi:hypothetical protein
VICDFGKAEYFYRQGWTRRLRNSLTGKSVELRAKAWIAIEEPRIKLRMYGQMAAMPFNPCHRLLNVAKLRRHPCYHDPAFAGLNEVWEMPGNGAMRRRTAPAMPGLFSAGPSG